MPTAARKKAKETKKGPDLVPILRQWQGIEDMSVAGCTALMEQTKNPLVRLVMEIIRQDSVVHKKVQQLMIDSLEKEAISLSPDELALIWDGVERHAAMEKETIELATEALGHCRLLALRNLLTYLLEDEKKHDRLLSQLEDFKRGIYPYA